MYHSVTIGDKNTWTDWRLIPSTPPTVNPPPVRKNMVELPGGNGSIDLTQFLGGSTRYGVIEGTWEFVISDQDSFTREQWAQQITDYLHGKRFDNIVLEDVPGWCYSGRFEVGGVKVGKNFSTITIGYTMDPFKHKVMNSEVTSL